MKIFRRLLAPAALSFLAACATANPSLQETIAQLDSVDEEIAYVCPMHADVTSDTPGSCEKCGMALVKGTPYDMRDFRLQTSFTPEVPKAGEPVRLNFQVMSPGTDTPVTDFELVHEMPYHLFVLSQDMEYFQHIHPAGGENGNWAIDVTLPKPGHYALISDFAPKGASSQMTLRPLVTADADEDLLDGTAKLTLDESPTSAVKDLTATVSFDPPTLIAGQHGHVIYNLTDTESGVPVNQLQTYLGAFGHLFIIDERMSEYVHSHPVETPSAQLNLDEIRGGPTVMFEGLMPKPGRYRAWAQFKYHDEIYTFSTTFDVAEVGTGFRR
jgi:hypothetical protein